MYRADDGGRLSAERLWAAVSVGEQAVGESVALEAQIDPARIPARAIGVLPFAVVTSDTLLQPLGYAMAEFLTRVRLLERPASALSPARGSRWP